MKQAQNKYTGASNICIPNFMVIEQWEVLIVKKRPVLVWLVLALLLGLFIAGCGSKQSPEKTPIQPSSPSQPQPKETSLSQILAKGQGIKSMSYDFVMTAPEITQTGKVWIDGNRLKTDSTVQGKRIITIFDRATNTAITYYPEQNQAVKMSAGAGSNKTPAPTDYTGNLNPDKVKLLRTETYDGSACKVLEVLTPGQQGEKVLLWVREDLGVPVKVEVTAPSGEKTVMEYKNLQAGPIPDEVFQLPPGVQVTDLGQMMDRLPANLPGR